MNEWMNEWTSERANRRICTRDYYWETSILLFQQSISIEGVSTCCATNPLKLHFQLFLGNVKLISIQYFSTWNQLNWFFGWMKRNNIVEKWLHALMWLHLSSSNLYIYLSAICFVYRSLMPLSCNPFFRCKEKNWFSF